MKPGSRDKDFGDLLSGHDFSSKAEEQAPKSMKEMRRKQLEESTDPDVLKVRKIVIAIVKKNNFSSF